MDIDKVINSYQAFVKNEKPEDVVKKKDDTLGKIKDISALAGLLENIRTAFDLVADAVAGRYKGVSKGTIALLVGGLAYLALPIDIVPDFIPVAGWLDDAAVLAWIFARCTDEIKKYKEFKTPSP